MPDRDAMTRTHTTVLDSWADDGSRLKFRIVGRSPWGPRKSNPIYEHQRWTVTRHLWELPDRHWAWKAEPTALAQPRDRRTVYGDDLATIAHEIRKKEAAR